MFSIFYVNFMRAAVNAGRPLKLARRQVAYRDLRRVGRNLHLVDESLIREERQ